MCTCTDATHTTCDGYTLLLKSIKKTLIDLVTDDNPSDWSLHLGFTCLTDDGGTPKELFGDIYLGNLSTTTTQGFTRKLVATGFTTNSCYLYLVFVNRVTDQKICTTVAVNNWRSRLS